MAKSKKKTAFDPYRYLVNIVWSTEDEAYVATVPELEGCQTHGDTFEEATHMAAEAITAYVEALKKMGQPVPVPISEKEYSGKYLLRLGKELHRDIDLRAKRENKSIKAYIVERLKKTG